MRPGFYRNPLISEAEGGLTCGDPFAMRFDGKYYLYCSARGDGRVYCQTSTDLVHWTRGESCIPLDEIPTITSEHGHYGVGVAYAPEVTYYNGKFYMVTSFGGTGHRTLVADRPEGPFKRKTENWGQHIDGDIFIDNDGKWRFYSADGRGIKYFDMVSPINIDPDSLGLTGAIIDDGWNTWTEGSMIVYHDGTYFLTYTGNHVCSNSYRIDYAISHDGPTKFTMAKKNPLLISSDVKGHTHGTGHSSSVKGPDLDSYYIVYHAMSDRGRTLNIDRLYFNGDMLEVMGPTTNETPICAMPKIYSFFENPAEKEKFEGMKNGKFEIRDGVLRIGKENDDIVLAKDELSSDYYTIELTTKSLAKGGKAGGVFSYKDENNYGYAMFDTTEQTLVVGFKKDGEDTVFTHPLVKSFDEDYDFYEIQAIQIEKKGDAFTFFVNDRELCKHNFEMDGTRVGVITEGLCALYSYFGATPNVSGTSHKDHYKPISAEAGIFLGVHCVERDTKSGFIKETNEEYLVAENGRKYTYKVNVDAQTSFDIALRYRSKKGAKVTVYVDDQPKCTLELAPAKDFRTEISRELGTIRRGLRTLALEFEGDADILSVESMPNEYTTYIDDLAKVENYPIQRYKDGPEWKVENGAIIAQNAGKRTYGTRNWGDYEVSFDMKLENGETAFGVLVRALNPCIATLLRGNLETHENIEEARRCLNWFEGYSVDFSKDGVVIKKCTFDSTDLAEAFIGIEIGKTYKVKVVCKLDTITAYIDGKKIVEYTDPDPYIQGMPGFRSTMGRAIITNASVKGV